MAAEPKFDTANCLAKWEAVKVGEKGSIPAAEFLDACDAIISIFDCLGSGLGMVKKDMVGNVTHIRNNMANFPPDVTLDAMVQKDIEAKVTHKDGTTAMSLLWLKRALQFLEQLLAQLTGNKGMEVADAGRAAYATTLTQHHNFAVRQVFKVAMSAAPYRADFFAKMGGPEEETVPKLAAFTPMFSASLVSLEEYFLAQGLEQPAK